MTHNSLCLDGLDDQERAHIMTAIDPAFCEFCVLISKARAVALAEARDAVLAVASAGQGPAVPPRQFVHTASATAAIDTLRSQS